MVSSILKGQAQEGSHLSTLLPPDVGQQPETDPFHPQHTGGWQMLQLLHKGCSGQGINQQHPFPLFGLKQMGECWNASLSSSQREINAGVELKALEKLRYIKPHRYEIEV